jgi:3-oxoacyl-[acyl-carrier protein] reductase
VLGLSRKAGPADFEIRTLDVREESQIKKLVADLRQSGSEVAGLINSAGIASMNLAVMTPPSTARNIIGTNLLGTIFMCQSFVPMMVRAGGGAVVNFSTIAVSLGLEGEAVYSASKSGVEAYSRTLAREMSGFGVRVNCVAPGPVDTQLTRGVPQSSLDAIVDRQVIRKQFSVEDVCDVVEILMSPKASSVSGQVINIGGV